MKRLLGVFVVAFLCMAFYPKALSADEINALVSQTVLKHDLNAPVDLLTSMAFVESSGVPVSLGDGGNAYGLFQVWHSTAKDLYERLGYQAYSYNHINLMRPEVSAYFACAYFDWLNAVDHDKSEEWKVRAYNGGRGWERSSVAVANTEKYWEKVVDGLSY